MTRVQTRGRMDNHNHEVVVMTMALVLGWCCVNGVKCGRDEEGGVGLITASQLEKFVDPLPDMPRIKAFHHHPNQSSPTPLLLRIGMFRKKWVWPIYHAVFVELVWVQKFHRDLPPTPVFAYGLSRKAATVPGPTIEALYGIETHVKWTNHLSSRSHHILPWDPTLPTATSPAGIPTVVHLHGGLHHPTSDGHSTSWFTSGFRNRGPSWSQKIYRYPNFQHPGTLWYHDHAMGLTRVNLLAGLVGAFVIYHPRLELPLGLPYADHELDRPLVVFDRSFRTDGLIYMNATGDNPSIHPQWQPEYFGDAIIVNGKAWPRMVVRRRRYRFRIINASNARFFKFYMDDATLRFVHVASDSAYIKRPVMVKEFLLAPSEIADVIIDFSKSTSNSAILCNNAPYPYPSGDPVNEANSKVMKFIIKELKRNEVDKSRIPPKLMTYPQPTASAAAATVTRYIGLYEYTSSTDEPTHMYINGKPFEAPATEKPKVGGAEIWYVINLTEDNHPLHVHLGLVGALEQVELVEVEEFKECMMKVNDARKCQVEKHARGKKVALAEHEKGWKNVYKMMPGYMTKIVVRFSYIHTNASYRFDATAEPGYVYHCHILDHEDNVMMRPLKLTH